MNRVTIRRGLALLFALLSFATTRAVERPPREHVEAKGWTIFFAPEDRLIAEQLAQEIESFDHRLAEVVGLRHELGSEELEKRAEELAAKAGAVLRLPGKSAELRPDFVRVAQAIRGVTDALREMFFPHKIEIWHEPDIRARLSAGEKIEGFTWDPATRRFSANLKFNWELDPVDYHVTKTMQMLPAVMVNLEASADAKAELAAARKSLDDWVSIARQMQERMEPWAIAGGMHVALRSRMKGEFADDAASTWLREGLIDWVWRELVLQSMPAKNAWRYTPVIAQLRMPNLGEKPPDLEVWPKEEAFDYVSMARQVFLNIVEADAPETLPRLLEAFWKLPVAERTSANFRRLYREQTGNALERRAPLRSLR